MRIGGEFEVDPNDLSYYDTSKFERPINLYSSGRSAFLEILKTIRSSKAVIHVPYYICESIVRTCLIGNFQIKFYEPDSGLNFPLSYLERVGENDTLLLVNYFGFCPLNEIVSRIKLIKPNINIVGDEVQSFWTYNDSNADYAFTSLRKHFAVPDGGLMKANGYQHNIDNSLRENSFYTKKILGSILKFQQYPDSIFLRFFEEGERDLDKETDVTRGSELGRNLFERINLDNAAFRRRENYRLIYEMGTTNDLEFVFTYNEAVIPMNIPLRLRNRDYVRRDLMAKNIFLPVHWKQAEYNLNSAISKQMAESELSLVTDQRYSGKEIEYQMQNLIKIIKKYG